MGLWGGRNKAAGKKQGCGEEETRLRGGRNKAVGRKNGAVAEAAVGTEPVLGRQEGEESS